MSGFIRVWPGNIREDQTKHLLVSYRNLVSQYNACLELFATMYPNAVSQIREVTYIQAGINHAEESMANLLDHRERCLCDLHKKFTHIRAIEIAVDSLEADEYAVINRYYMAQPRRRIEDIAKDLHMSESSCWRAHRRGLQKLVERLTPPDSDKAK